MIKIDFVRTFGIELAICGMRNPLNSWGKSDSNYINGKFTIGENDLILMKKLVKAGSDHRKFLRMIHVQMNIEAPLYWWKEFDTYKIGTAANSCSTMHTITHRPLNLYDFATDNITDTGFDMIVIMMEFINRAITRYNNETDKEEKERLFRTIIATLPSSYMQLRTIDLNYEVLMKMCLSRKNHKLSEWRTFVETFDGEGELFDNEKIPYFKELMEVANDKKADSSIN